MEEERWDWTRAKKVDSSKTQYRGPKQEGDVYLTDLPGQQACDFIRDKPLERSGCALAAAAGLG